MTRDPIEQERAVALLRIDPTRFWSKVALADNDDCWLWKASLDYHGYGRFGLGSREAGVLGAHRVAYILTRNCPIPPRSLDVLHSCDTPACCNPHHLALGTRSDNMRDAQAKGRLRPYRGQGEMAGRAKLTNDQVREIRAEASLVRHIDLATRYGVSRSLVGQLARREIWTHIS